MIPATPEAFTHLSLGQPIRTESQAWGLTYPGEVVRIERWAPHWGRDLPSDLCFRLVLLTTPGRARSPAGLADDRIAVLLPTPGVPTPSGLLRERRRAYAGGILAQVAGIAAVVGRTAEALSSTSLSGPDALRAFADAFVQARYPAPPVDLAGAAEPLGPAQARLVWEGIASPTPRAEARAAALHYGPRLGLAQGGLGPGSVARLIAEAARAAGPAGLPLAPLRLRILRESSLPPHLTMLYLLVAALRAEPPLALGLAPGARIPLSGGRLYAEERLTSHLLPAVPWSDEIETAVASLTTEASPTWRGVRPYLQLLLGDTEEMDEGQVAARLQTRRAPLVDAQAQVEALGQEMGAPLESLHLLDVMRPLDTILQARRPADLLARVREAYPTVIEVAEAAAALHQVEEMARIAPAVGSAWRYLQGATPGERDTDLALDRETVLARMELGALLAAPELWPSIEEAFAAYRARYIQRYLEARDALYSARAALHERLEEAAPKVAALERLNAIHALGPALAAELPGAHATLLQQTGPCTVRDQAALLQQAPRCPGCAMDLDRKPPVQDVEALLHRLGRALRDQRRRLGSQAVRQVLARGGVDRLDRFLQAVQASDVSALTSLLDDNLVAFIESFLQASGVHAPQRSILERLQARFPTVGPEEVNLAAAELARLLRQELEEAQRQAPARRAVRVTLK